MDHEDDETPDEKPDGFDAEELEKATPEADNAEIIARAREELTRIDPIAHSDLRKTIESIQRISSAMDPIVRAQEHFRAFSEVPSVLATIERNLGGAEAARKLYDAIGGADAASKVLEGFTPIQRLSVSMARPPKPLASPEPEVVEITGDSTGVDDNGDVIERVERVVLALEARLDQTIVSNEILREINGKLTTVSLATVGTNEHLQAQVAQEIEAKRSSSKRANVATLVAIVSAALAFLAWQFPKSAPAASSMAESIPPAVNLDRRPTGDNRSPSPVTQSSPMGGTRRAPQVARQPPRSR